MPDDGTSQGRKKTWYGAKAFVYFIDGLLMFCKRSCSLNTLFYIYFQIITCFLILAEPLFGYRARASNLYYYRSAVRKNLSSQILSSKFDEFLAVHSQFDTDHRVNFYAHTCCQSVTFGPLFAFYYPLFFTEKIIKMLQFATDAIFTQQFSRRCRHRLD